MSVLLEKRKRRRKVALSYTKTVSTCLSPYFFKSYGSALEFVWRPEGTGEYGVRESPSKIKLFKNFKQIRSFRPNFSAEGIFGGTLIGVR